MLPFSGAMPGASSTSKKRRICAAAKLRDSGFPDERLKMLGKALTPGTSAIIAVIEHRWVAEYEQALAEYGADVVTQAVEASIAAQLETTASAGTGSTQPKGTQS